jgi:hypothetical protein
MRLARLLPALTVLVVVSAWSCNNAHTGFIITVDRPDTHVKQPGTDYNALYVDVVTSDGAEQSTCVPITASTTAPYVIVVTMDGQQHTEAQQIVVSLLQYPQPGPICTQMEGTDGGLAPTGTIIASYRFPSEAVVQHQLTPLTADLTNL